MIPLTPKEYATAAKVHIKTVVKWCRLRRIKSKRFGSRWRIYDDPAKA